jgi:hypothetical protein
MLSCAWHFLRAPEALIELREQVAQPIRWLVGNRRVKAPKSLAESRVRRGAVSDVIGLDRSITRDCL